MSLSIYDLATKPFRPVDVSFNQDKCVICQNEFQIDEVIVELACKHIFHPEDLGSEYIACPLCKKSIESRDRQFSRTEIDQLVDSLFQKVVRYFPKPVKLAQYLHLDFSLIKNGIANFLVNYQMQPRTFILKHNSRILNLDIFNRFLDNFSNPETYRNNSEALLEEYKKFGVKRTIDIHNEMPLRNDNFYSIDELAKLWILIFKRLFHQPDLLVDFCEKLKVEMEKDEELALFFQQRKDHFIQLNKEFFQNKNFLGKAFSARGYTREQIVILSENLPGFKTSYRLNCIIRLAEIIIIVGILHKLNFCDLKNFRSKPIRNLFVAYHCSTALYNIIQDFASTFRTSKSPANRSVGQAQLPQRS